jgi:hypothetical protein
VRWQDGLLQGARDLGRDDVAELLSSDGRPDCGLLSDLLLLLHRRQRASPPPGPAGKCWFLSPEATATICEGAGGHAAGPIKSVPGTDVAAYGKVLALLRLPLLRDEDGARVKKAAGASPAVSPPYAPELGRPASGPQEYACVEIALLPAAGAGAAGRGARGGRREKQRSGPIIAEAAAGARLHCALDYVHGGGGGGGISGAFVEGACRLLRWAAAWAQRSGQPELARRLLRAAALESVAVVPFGTSVGHPVNGLLAAKAAACCAETHAETPVTPRFRPADFAALRQDAVRRTSCGRVPPPPWRAARATPAAAWR